MKRVERILVATDFSQAGSRAVHAAMQWARRDKAALRILHVAPPKRWLGGLWGADAATIRRIHQHATAALRRLAEAVDPERQLEISTGLQTGSASREIVRAAKDFNTDLLVIGSGGEHYTAARPVSLGGTATKLLTTTAAPLLLVRRDPSKTSDTVLAAVDLSTVSGAVIEWACLSAQGRQLHVFHAYEVPFATRLEAYGLAEGAIEVYTENEHAKRDQQLAALVQENCGGRQVQQLVERGEAATRLLENIGRLEPALVVVGKQTAVTRRPGSTGNGSVCRYAATFSPGDVLVVPPAGD